MVLKKISGVKPVSFYCLILTFSTNLWRDHFFLTKGNNFMLKILNEIFLFAFLLFLIIGADGITDTFLNALGV